MVFFCSYILHILHSALLDLIASKRRTSGGYDSSNDDDDSSAFDEDEELGELSEPQPSSSSESEEEEGFATPPQVFSPATPGMLFMISSKPYIEHLIYPNSFHF